MAGRMAGTMTGLTDLCSLTSSRSRSVTFFACVFDRDSQIALTTESGIAERNGKGITQISTRSGSSLLLIISLAKTITEDVAVASINLLIVFESLVSLLFYV